jgi:hypothetical protein
VQDHFPIELSVEEMKALLELVEDQLFRMKYIDPKLPGHRSDPNRLSLANSAVSRIREVLYKAKGHPVRTKVEG